MANHAGPHGLRLLKGVAPQIAPHCHRAAERATAGLGPLRGRHALGLKVTAVTDERVGFKVSEHDPVRQRLKSQHVVIRDREICLYPVEVRYAWPAELDLMARLAGLRLRHRWSDWNRTAIGPHSERHVSVYERIG